MSMDGYNHMADGPFDSERLRYEQEIKSLKRQLNEEKERYTDAVAALPRLIIQRDSLKRYAEHTAYCELSISPDRECSCGLDDLLECIVP